MEKREMNELSKIILVELNSRYEFVKADWLDIAITQTETSGFLLRKFLLSEVLRWINKEEHQKEQLLDILNAIAKRGKLAIFWMGITREMDYTDLACRCWIGEGVKYFEKNILVPQVRIYRMYSENPLRKTEREKLRVITEVKETALRTWKKRDDFFEYRYRSHDLNLEFRQHQRDMINRIMRKNEKI